MGLSGLRVRLEPTLVQRRSLAATCGASRFAYNYALGKLLEQRRIWAAEVSSGVPQPERTKVPSAQDLNSLWTREADTLAPWRKNHPAKVYQLAINDAHHSFKLFLKGASGLPRWKGRSAPRTFRIYRSIHLRPGTLKLPGLGEIRIANPDARQSEVRRLIRRGSARIVSASVRQDATGEWWASLLFERTSRSQWALNPSTSAPSPSVGIDVGVTNLLVAALSSGVEVARVERIPSQERKERKALRAQRRLSRQDRAYAGSAGSKSTKASPSKGRATTKRALARARRKATWARTSQLHQATTGVVNALSSGALAGAPVVLETLDVKRMVERSPRRGFTRSLMEVRLGEAHRQLSYKLGPERVLQAPRFHPSSKLCSVCGHLELAVVLGVHSWSCRSCSATHERDFNAATNLAAWGDRHLSGIQAGYRSVNGPSAPYAALGHDGGTSLRRFRSEPTEVLVSPPGTTVTTGQPATTAAEAPDAPGQGALPPGLLGSGTVEDGVVPTQSSERAEQRSRTSQSTPSPGAPHLPRSVYPLPASRPSRRSSSQREEGGASVSSPRPSRSSS